MFFFLYFILPTHCPINAVNENWKLFNRISGYVMKINTKSWSQLKKKKIQNTSKIVDISLPLYDFLINIVNFWNTLASLDQT